MRGLLPPFFGGKKTPVLAATSSAARHAPLSTKDEGRKENIAGPKESSALFLRQPSFSPVDEEEVRPPYERGALPTVSRVEQIAGYDDLVGGCVHVVPGHSRKYDDISGGIGIIFVYPFCCFFVLLLGFWCFFL